MIRCKECGFEAKSDFGLSVHVRKHKEVTVTPPKEVVSKPVEKKTIANLVDKDGNITFAFSLEKSGQEWVKLATQTAEKKNLTVKFK